MAITYGGSRMPHGWWFTVNVSTVPRPVTASGATARDEQLGHTGAGGCTYV